MTVRVWRSTDKDAPVLTGQQGKMCDLLNEVLTRGYPRQSGATITRSGSTAQVSLTGHTFYVGQEVSISGAVEPEYNGNVIITAATANTFDYTVSGTPTTPATGTILVGGEKQIGEIIDMTRSGSTVTAVIESHGLSVGNRFRVVGADQSGYNGIQTVATVVDVDTVTFTLPASVTPATPATGTLITARYGTCGAGWSSPYSGTNKRIFKQGVSANGATQAVLRLNETDATNHTYGVGMLMAEGATGIDTLTNSCYTTEWPQYTGMWKSATADSVARPWVVIGDHRTFYVLTKPGYGSTYPNDWLCSFFGDIASYKPNDLYPQVCGVAYRTGYPFSSVNYIDSYSMTSSNSCLGTITTYAYIPGYTDTSYPLRMFRNHLAQSGLMQCFLKGVHPGNANTSYLDTHHIGRVTAQVSGASVYDTYPDPVHGGINMGRVGVMHTVTAPATGTPVARGLLRGLWEPYHRRTAMTGWANNDVFNGSGPLAGKTFEAFFLVGDATAWLILETSDTWETA